MIKTQHPPFYVWLSDIYSNFFLHLAFRNIRFIGDNQADKDRPVLMIANHFAWWDGFIQIRLNLRVFKKRFYFMMLEKEIIKNPILKKIGACSISKGSRGVLETLQYMMEILQNPKNMYLFFPQGKIQSLYTFPFTFEKGALNYVLKKKQDNLQLVFNINLIDYSSFKRPELSVYYKTFHIDTTTTSEAIEQAYNMFAETCLNQQKAA